MRVPQGCRVVSYGEIEDPKKKVLIIDFHGATWEAFAKAFAFELKGFSAEELVALKDYCNYHRDNGVPEMAKETAERIVKLQAGVRVDVFSVVDIPRAIVDCNRNNFEGESPAFEPHIAEKFGGLRDKFLAFHAGVQGYLSSVVGGYDAVFDLHSMNGWDLNENGREEAAAAMKIEGFAERLRRLVKVGTTSEYVGRKRENNLFSKDGRGEVRISRKFNRTLQKYLSGGGFKWKVDKPYHLLSRIFSARVAEILQILKVHYSIIDVNICSLAENGECPSVHLDTVFDFAKVDLMCDALAYAIISVLESTE